MEALINGFINDQPYEVIVKPDPLYATRDIQYVRLTKQLPWRISGLASDVVKNLRAALDQVGYAVAVAAGKNGKNAHFPFGDTRAEVESRRNRRSKDIPSSVFDVMLALQPYQGGNETLWRLNKLANTNKHESLVKAVLFVNQIIYDFPDVGTLLKPGPKEATEDEIQVAWLRRGETHMKYDLNVSVSVSFTKIGDIVINQPVVALLNQTSSIVERVLLAVEAEARRLNLIT
jgi:hypothetical protein